MSIGILTSGGDAPGMNAAIRAAFRCLKMRAPDCELILFRDGFRGLARRLDSSSDRSVDRKDVRDIIHRGGTFIGTGRVPELVLPPADVPDFAARVAAREAFLRVAAVNLFQHQIEALIVIGGDGSFCGARAIAAPTARPSRGDPSASSASLARSTTTSTAPTTRSATTPRSTTSSTRCASSATPSSRTAARSSSR
jgi:6-phosphofructokinase 1